MTKIPSDEVFERAKRIMAEESIELDSVCAQINERFKVTGNFHRIYILPQRDVDFRAYVFFKKQKDLEDYVFNDRLPSFEDAVFEELERFGRGKRNEITVAFEWDSDENVDKKFEGDYLQRLQ